MKNTFLLLLATMFGSPIFAQEHTHADGSTHSDHGAEAAKTDSPAGKNFTIYAEGERYELTLKHLELEAGKPAEFTLFIADRATNEPLAGLEIRAAVQEDASISLAVQSQEAGVYQLAGIFPKNEAYSIAINLNSKARGADLLLLKPVEIGKKLTAAAELGHTHAHTHWWHWALAILGGFGLGWLAFRQKPRAAAVFLIALAVPTFFQNANAHGDDDHGASKNGSSMSDEIFIPKETQFLFDIRTQAIGAGDFAPSVKLFGTIVAAPSGFAQIIAPQGGRVVSLKIQPGQRVSAGQILAVLKPFSSQSEQVGIAVETGKLAAEIESAKTELAAAEREKNRLVAIADVAAKRDVQAAEARFAAAKTNLASLENLSNGAVSRTINGEITLKSPISGIVGAFALATGAEVLGGATLFDVTDLSKVFVEAQVYDRDAAAVEAAKKFTASCANDDHKTAEVRLISKAQSVNPTNQSQKMLFALSNASDGFKIGEFVTIQAFQPVAGRQLFVPNSAISEINGKPVVFHKHAPEVYEVSYLSLGEDNGEQTVVLKGLEAGERLVVFGTYQVKMMLQNQ